MKFRNVHINKIKLLLWIGLGATLLIFLNISSYEGKQAKSEALVNDILFHDIEVDFGTLNRTFAILDSIKTQAINNETNSDSEVASDYVESIANILAGKFTKASEVRSPSEEHINVGFILINLDHTSTDLSDKFKKSLKRTLYTMFVYWTWAPINLVIITDNNSVNSVARFIAGVKHTIR